MSAMEADGDEGIDNLKLSVNGKGGHSAALMETAAGAAAVGVIGETTEACSLASCNLSSLCSL